jgi:hypothetical protein
VVGLDHYAELTSADEKANVLFGDSFCAIDAAQRREIFYWQKGEALLLGRGSDFDEAFAQAIPHYARFYANAS